MIAEEGPQVGGLAFGRFLRAYERILKRCSFVAMGGSVPPGIDEGVYGDLTGRARRAGVPVLLDASGTLLERGIQAGPTIVKADHRFVSEVLGVPLTTLENLRNLTERIAAQGIPWVVVNYRQYGDLFVTPSGTFLAEIGSEGVLSLFNAGDALLAGLLIALEEKMDAEEAVRFSMACAWANSVHVAEGIRSRREAESFLGRRRSRSSAVIAFPGSPSWTKTKT
jgi:fructose-1-phosphate kinase PfkB-like protein